MVIKKSDMNNTFKRDTLIPELTFYSFSSYNAYKIEALNQ